MTSHNCSLVSHYARGHKSLLTITSLILKIRYTDLLHIIHGASKRLNNRYLFMYEPVIAPRKVNLKSPLKQFQR